MIPRHRVMVISITLALLGMVVIAGLSLQLFLSSDALRSELRSTIASALTAWTGLDVAIGDVDSAFPGRFMIKDIVVKDVSGEVILKVPRMGIGYSLLGYVVYREEPLRSITHISLEDPVLLLEEDARGEWNLKDIPALSSLFSSGGKIGGEEEHGVPPKNEKSEDGGTSSPPASHSSSEGDIHGVPGSSSKGKEGRLAAQSTPLTHRLPRIELNSGIMIIRPYGLEEYRIEDVYGIIEAKEVLLFLTASGVTGDSGGSRLNTEGTVNIEEGLFDVKLNFSELDLGYLARAIPVRLPFASIYSGKAGGHLRLSGDPRDAMMLAGDVQLSKGTLEIPTVDGTFEGVSGSFSLTQSGLEIRELTGELDGIPVRVSGKVLDFSAPVLKLDLSAGFNLLKYYVYTSSLLAQLGLEGEGSVQARIEGPAKAPAASGTANLKRGLLYGQPVEDVVANFGYKERRLSMSGIKGKMSGGTFSGDLILDLTQKASPYAITISLAGIGLEGVNLPSLPTVVADKGTQEMGDVREFIKIGGRLDGEAVINGEVGRTLDVAGSARVTEATIVEADFDTLEGLFRFNGKEKLLTLDQVVGQGDSRLTLSGGIHLNDGADLKIDVKGFDVGKILSTIGIKGLDLQGTGEFNGDLHGPLSAPQVTGLFRINDGRLLGQGFDKAEGTLEWSWERVELSDVVVKNKEMEYQISGEIKPGDGEGGGDMALDVKVKEVDLKQLLRIAQISPTLLAGRVSGAFKIDGPFSMPRTYGSIRIVSGRLYNFLLDEGTLTFRLEGKDFHIEDFKGVINGSPVHLQGALYDARVLDLAVDAHQVDLTGLNIKGDETSLQPVGKIDFKGTVRGPVDTFDVAGKVSGERAGIGKLLFDRVEGDLRFTRGGAVPFFRLSFEKGGGVYSVEGDLASGDRRRNLFNAINVKIEEGDLQDLFYLCQLFTGFQASLNNELSGKVGGRIDLRSESGSILGEASLKLGGVDGGTGRINEVFLEASINDRVVTINRLEAGGEGEGNLVLHGIMDLGGEINMNASAEGFELSPLLGLLGVDYDIKGRGDFSLTIRGKTSGPQFLCDLNVKEMAVEGFPLGAVEGSFDIRGGLVNIEHVTVRKNGHEMLLDGKFPLSRGRLVDVEGSDAYLELKGADFGFLPVIFPELGATRGGIDALLRLSYSGGVPRLYGYLNLREGEIRNDYLMEPLTQLQANVEFTGESAVIRNISGSMGKNGRLKGEGKVNIEGFSLLAIDLTLNASGMGLAAAGYRGYADLDLKIKGSGGMDATLNGKIRLYNGEVLPQPVNMAIPPSVTLWDPKLDLEISAGRGVSLKGKGIDVPFTGQLHLGGSLSSPLVEGSMESSRGQFVLFGTQFDLKKAVAEFSRLNGLTPTLNVTGEGIVQGITIYVDMIGRPDSLKTTWRSEPPLREDEIISLLTVPKVISDLIKGGVGEEGVSSSVLRYLENEISSQLFSGVSDVIKGALPVDEFMIERGTKQGLEIKIGKYLIDILYLGYIKELSLDDDRGSWILEYRAQPNISLKGSIEGNGEYRFSLEARYQF